LKIINKVNKGLYQNINVECTFIIDSFNTSYSKNKPNIEIEDFIYPEIILELANQIFKKRKDFKKILESSFMKRINNPSLRYNGILEMIDTLKNERNPEIGLSFSTKESGFKGGLANNFNLKGNSFEIEKVLSLDLQYPEVKKFLTELTQN
jgi:hypothetical protein